jgi:DNA-binding beta-propeller fold protein YncE
MSFRLPGARRAIGRSVLKISFALWISALSIVAIPLARVAADTRAGPAATDRLYVTNSSLRAEAEPANVARFTVGPSGELTLADTVETGEGARGIVFTPARDRGQRFAYVPSQLVEAIVIYRVTPDGALSPLGTAPASQPFAVAIAPRGEQLYVSSQNGDLIAFQIAADGQLALLNTVTTGRPSLKGISVVPDGRFVYVTHRAADESELASVTGYAIAADGSIGSEVAAAPVARSGHRVLVTPNGRFLYVTNQVAEEGPDIFGFEIGASGELAPVPGASFEGGVWTEGAAVSPDGATLFITALGEVGDPALRDGQIRGFAIGTSGELSEIGRSRLWARR